MNPEDDDLSTGRGLQRGTNEPKIAGWFRNDMVGGKNTHHRVGVDGLQDVSCQSDSRRGVALGRLGEDLVFRDFGQLSHNLGTQMVVGKNPLVLGRDHRAEPVHRLLDQRAFSQEAQHLFGMCAAAARPKARTSATGQNEAVVIGWFCHQLCG